MDKCTKKCSFRQHHYEQFDNGDVYTFVCGTCGEAKRLKIKEKK